VARAARHSLSRSAILLLILLRTSKHLEAITGRYARRRHHEDAPPSARRFSDLGHSAGRFSSHKVILRYPRVLRPASHDRKSEAAGDSVSHPCAGPAVDQAVRGPCPRLEAVFEAPSRRRRPNGRHDHRCLNPRTAGVRQALDALLTSSALHWRPLQSVTARAQLRARAWIVSWNDPAFKLRAFCVSRAGP